MAAATGAAAAEAVAVKAPPVQPSRELAHVRYFIDGSVDAGVHGKVRPKHTNSSHVIATLMLVSCHLGL